MKYYAVTEDPNELFHYGRKGMKWGKHIFGDKPKSPGYHRAVSKLKSIKSDTKKSLKKTVVAAKKTSAQIAENRRKHQEQKFERAVEKDQHRSELTQALYNRDMAYAAEKQARRQEKQLRKAADAAEKRINKEYKKANRDNIRQTKNEIKLAKIDRKLNLVNQQNQIRDAKKAVKAEKHMDKLMQEAREGRLKYGQLNEDQVSRLRDRLNMENQARQLGGREKSTLGREVRGALRKGIVEGIAGGTAAAMTELAKAKVQTTIAGKHIQKKKAEQDAKNQKRKNQILNKRSKSEIRDELKEDLYEAKIYQNSSKGQQLRKLNEAKDARRYEIEQERKQNEEQHRYELEQVREQKRLEDNDRRNEERLLEAAKSAYEYGYVPSYLMSGGGNNSKKKKKGNNGQQQNNGNNNGQQNSGNDIGSSDIEKLADYYKLRVIQGQTLQEKKAKKEAKQREERAAAIQARLNAQREMQRRIQEQREAAAERQRQEKEAYIARRDAAEKQRYRENIAWMGYQANERYKDDLAKQYRERVGAKHNYQHGMQILLNEANAKAARSNELSNNLGNPRIGDGKKHKRMSWMDYR